MSDEDDHQTPLERLEEALEPILQDGDAFVARKRDGEIQIAVAPQEIPSARSALQHTNPELYGWLLRVNQRVADSGLGCGLPLVLGIAVLGTCFAIQAQAFHGLFDDGSQGQNVLEQLRSWWVYGIVALVGVLAGWKADSVLEKAAWEREQQGVSRKLSAEGMQVDAMIAAIQGDEGLSTLGKYLKLETPEH